MELIKTLFKACLNLVYNQKCIICGCSKTDNNLCKTCLKDVEILSGFAHRVFNKIPIYCAYIYSKNIKKLIQLLKFSHKKKAAKPLAYLLFNYYQKLNLNNNFIIIYPPAFSLKSASRGYNPLKLITLEFSKLTELSIEDNLLKKIKYTKPQYNAKNRRKNIKGSFEVNKKLVEKYKDKNLLLIDDITTSGATIEEIINCLNEAGLKNITVLTIARAGI